MKIPTWTPLAVALAAIIAISLTVSCEAERRAEPEPELPPAVVVPDTSPTPPPPAPQDSSVVSDVLAMCQLDLAAAEATIDSLQALPPGECPDLARASCAICAAGGVGWMCMLPANGL